jgi:hypothetical protein
MWAAEAAGFENVTPYTPAALGDLVGARGRCADVGRGAVRGNLGDDVGDEISPLARDERGRREAAARRIPSEGRGGGRGGAAVERAFGDLKHNYGLAPLRVRGLERVALHADLVIGRLGQALSRARALPLAV